MKRYQPYVWNGTKYVVMSVPVYKTEDEAIAAVYAIMHDRTNKSVLNSIRLHWKERPVITKVKEYADKGE